MQNLLFRISKRKPLFLRLFLAASLISVFVIVITWDELPYLSTDAHFYIELAEGQPQNVPKPFSTRVFHPIMVQSLTRISGLSIDQSFLAWGVFSLIILCLSVSLIIQSANVPNHLLVTVVVLATPLLLSLFRDYYLPDLFYAALLGLFFLLIIERSKLPEKYNGLSLLGFVQK